MRQKSTVWQSRVFNSGQFACDRPLYDFDSLRLSAEASAIRNTCLENQFHEQPGMNALVFASGVVVSNLTLPPRCIESTWAGDYTTADYRSYWSDIKRTPCFIHWAGRKPDSRLPVDELFLNYLNDEEVTAWTEACKTEVSAWGKPKLILRKIRKLMRKRP